MNHWIVLGGTYVNEKKFGPFLIFKFRGLLKSGANVKAIKYSKH